MNAPSADRACKYWAFISYSHADERFAAWLHRKLETYRVTKELVGSSGRHGPVPARAFPAFRDRDELEGSADLPGRIEEALAASRFLIVICSPRSARSPWVNEEIRRFKSLAGEDRVLALILDGEPHAGAHPEWHQEECFPEALRWRLASDGSLSATPAEPIAADARKGKDGPRLALLKLLAAVLGVRFDDLRRRDQERERRRWLALTAVVGAVAVVLGATALFALKQRDEAERQRGVAEYERGIAEDRRQEAVRQQGIAEGEKRNAQTQEKKAREAATAERLARESAEERRRVALATKFAADARFELEQGNLTEALLMCAEAVQPAATPEAASACLSALSARPYLQMMLHGAGGAIRGLAVLPDGQIVAGSATGTLTAWSAAGRMLMRKAQQDLDVTAIAADPARARVAVGGRRGIALWSPGTGAWEPIDASLAYDRVLAWSGDGQRLAVSRDGAIQIWRLQPEGNVLERQLPGRGRFVVALAWDGAGQRIAWADDDGGLYVASAHSPGEAVALRSRGPSLRSLVFTPDGRMLLAAAARQLVMWRTGPGAMAGLGTAAGHPVPPWLDLSDRIADRTVTSLAIDVSGAVLAAGTEDGALLLWRKLESLLTGDFNARAPEIVDAGKTALASLAFGPGSRLVSTEALATPAAPLRVWDLRHGQTFSRAVPFESGRWRPGVSPDGSRIASLDSGGSQVVYLREPKSGRQWQFDVGTAIDNVFFASSGRAMVLRAFDGRVFFSPDGERAPLELPVRCPHKASLDAAGSMLACASDEGLELVRLADGQRRRLTLPQARHFAVGALAFDEAGARLAVGNFFGGEILLYEVRSGRLLSTLQLGDEEAVVALAFTPVRDELLVLHARGGRVGVWKLAERRLERSFRTAGERHNVNLMAVSRDGRWLGTGDGLWNLSTGLPLAAPRPRQAQQAHQALFSRDGREFITTQAEPGQALFTPLLPAQLGTAACTIANRNFTCEEWRQRIGPSDEPYRRACPGLPGPEVCRVR